MPRIGSPTWGNNTWGTNCWGANTWNTTPYPITTPSAPGGGDRIFAGDERALRRHLDKLKESRLDDELAEVISLIIAKGILN